MSEETDPSTSDEKLEVENNNTVLSLASNKLLDKISDNRSTNKVHVTSSIVCRICHTNTANECLISPCNCKGTLAYVHLSCLERWLNQSSRSYCELCMFRYSAIETKRYKLWQGLKLWIRHPMNRVHVRSDLLIGSLLTLVTSGLVACSVGGWEYFIAEGTKLGVPKKWIKAAICLFLITVIAGYVITMFLIIKDQFLPWYIWWTRTVDIHLLLPSVGDRKYVKKNDTTNVPISL